MKTTASDIRELMNAWMTIESECRRLGVPEEHLYRTASRVMSQEVGIEA